MRSLLCAVLVAPLVLASSAAFARHHAQSAPTTFEVVPTVTVTPAPGVSVRIPKDWMACEDDAAKLLSPGPDAMNLYGKFCGRTATVPTVLRTFDPKPFHLLSVIVTYRAQSPFTEAGMAAIKQEDLDELHGVICDAETKPLRDATGMQSSCDIGLTMFAGHHAIVSTIVETKAGEPGATYTITSYELAYAQGYVQFQFGAPDLVREIVEPERNAIMGSVVIDSTPAPTGVTPAPDAPAQPAPPPAPATPASSDSSI